MTVLLDLFNTVRVVLKLDAVKIDNNVFRLHYKLTMFLLIACSLLVTAKQFIGEPIECYFGNDDHKSINTYCWIYGTFTVKRHLKGKVGKAVIQQGVGAYNGDEEIIVQKYYQWVCLVLGLQAALFYIPRHLWKTWEGGLLRMLAGDLGLPIVSSDWTEERKQSILNYFTTRNVTAYNLYAARFVLCEILNAVNITMQFFMLNYFLGGDFMYYGPLVAAFSPSISEENIDPMAHLFPKVSKCIYREFGPSGGIQTIDVLCLLPLNVVNEKVFIVIWYWFVILSIISICTVIVRFVFIFYRRLRFYFLMAQCRFTERPMIEHIVNEFNYSEWFLLYMFGKNVNPLIFKELVSELGCRLPHKPSTV